MQQVECPRCLGIFACRVPSSGHATCSCSNCGCRVRMSEAGGATAELPVTSRPAVLIGLVAAFAAVGWVVAVALF